METELPTKQALLREEFATNMLNKHGVDTAKVIARKFSDLLDYLEQPDVCVPGRELAIARTHLEIACLYSKKAMSINDVNLHNSASKC